MRNRSLTTRAASNRLSLSVLLFAAACTQAAPEHPMAASSRMLISDAVHNDGNPGFFWLPPIAPTTAYGVFKAGLAPVVTVERLPPGSSAPIARFTTDAGRGEDRVRSDGVSHYVVEWKTKDAGLVSGETYRIRVGVGELELGFVDARVIDTGAAKGSVPADDYLPLVNGRTLPIKFRIDEAALRCVGVVCTAKDQCHLPGACDIHTGACTQPTQPDGTLCDDGSVCTTSDACVDGNCTGPTLDCADGNGCTYDGCHPLEGCVYVHQYGPTCEEPRPPDDVTIADFHLSNGPPFYPDQSLFLSVSLDAAADHPDYMMEFILFPADDPDPTRIGSLLHATYFEVVPAGVSQSWIEVTVPPGLAPGPYVLLAHEYPDGPFVRSVTQPSLEIGETSALPVLDLVEYVADSQALLVDAVDTVATPDQHLDYPFSGTLQAVARNHDAAGVPLRAYLRWNGARVPLQLWDSSSGRYADHLEASLAANEPTSVSLEAALSAADAATIRDSLPAQTPVAAEIEVTLNEGAAVAEAPCQDPVTGPSICIHELVVPAVLFLPPPEAAPTARISVRSALTTNGNPLVYEKSYRKFGEVKSIVGAGVQFQGKATLAKNGFEGRATAAVPARIFGNDFLVAEASAVALAPIDAPASFTHDFRMLGTSLSSGTQEGVSVAFGPLELFKVTKEVSYSYLFIVYCVPVDVVFGARGTLDVNVYVNAASTLSNYALASLDVSVIPHGNVSAFGAAGVGVRWHGFDLGAYLDANLSLVDTKFTAGVHGQLDVVVEYPKRFLRGSLEETLAYDLSLGGGSVKAVVYFPSISFCGPWYAPHPCLSGHWTKEKTLFRWAGYVLPTQTLLHKSQTGFEIALSDCTTCASEGAQCGLVPSVCGGTIDCGTCGTGYGCVGKTCVLCAPATCAAAGAECGAVTNNCGETLDCGTCASGTCQSNACVPCAPNSCAEAGAECGTVTNNCGVSFPCGTCTVGNVCSANRCVCDRLTCDERGWECGTGSDGCGGSLSCGSCGGGYTCSNHVCVPTAPTCSPPCGTGKYCCTDDPPYCVGDDQFCR